MPPQHLQQQKPQHTTSSLPPQPPQSSSSLYDTPSRPRGQHHQAARPDYTSEIMDLTQQITQMEWSPRQTRASRGRPPPGPPPSSAPAHRGNSNGNDRTTTAASAATDAVKNTNGSKSNTSNNSNQPDSMLFSPPPGGTPPTASAPAPSGGEYVPYTTTATTTVQTSHMQPVGILKDSRNGCGGQESDTQGQGHIQSGVISSGNGVVRDGELCTIVHNRLEPV